MNTKPNDSAHPEITSEDAFSQVNGGLYTSVYSYGGLTKREHFAALAMQSLIIAGAPMGQMSNSKEGVQVALQWADDLINELNKPPTP